MEVREEHQPFAQPRVFGLDRLLHLQQEVSLAPDRVGRCETGSCSEVGVVRKRRADPCPAFDEHVVAVLHELVRAGRSQRHSILLRLDLFHDPDTHGARDDS